MEKVVELVGRGSVINGAYPVQFSNHWFVFPLVLFENLFLVRHHSPVPLQKASFQTLLSFLPAYLASFLLAVMIFHNVLLFSQTFLSIKIQVLCEFSCDSEDDPIEQISCNTCDNYKDNLNAFKIQTQKGKSCNTLHLCSITIKVVYY